MIGEDSLSTDWMLFAGIGVVAVIFTVLLFVPLFLVFFKILTTGRHLDID